MKKNSKVLAMVLCITMLTSLLAVCVSARTTKDALAIDLPEYTGKDYQYYSFFGDSVPAGGALWKDSSGKDIGEYGFMRINWSYPDFLAETISDSYLDGGWDTSVISNTTDPYYYVNMVTKAWSTNVGEHAMRGVRVGDVRMLIEKSYKEDYFQMTDSYADFYAENYYKETQTFYEGLNTVLQSYGLEPVDLFKEIKSSLQKSDLITLTVGSNDIFTAPLAMMIIDGKLDLTNLSGNIPELSEITTIEDALNNLSAVYSYISSSAELVREFLSYVAQGVKNIKANYPALLADIQEVNGGKADIVVTGIYNPIAGLKVSASDTDTSLADSLSYVISAVNEIIINACNEYDNVYYVDIEGVETQLKASGANISDSNFAVRVLKEMHPTFAGHYEIASRIVEVLNDINACSHENTQLLNARKATPFRTGYTGDTYCADCGQLLKTGKLVTYAGSEFTIPRATLQKILTGIRTFIAGKLSSITG